MPKFDAILFDKDGTLFDFHKTWGHWSRSFLIDIAGGDMDAARRMARAVDFDLDAVRYKENSILVAATPHEIAEVLLPYLPEASLAALVCRMNALSADVEQQQATPLTPLFAELLARDLRIGVVTNDCEMPARSHLAASGVLHLLDTVIGCDSGFAAKPAPDMLLAFAETAMIEPAAVAVVGDSPHDMIAARAAGMTPVGVLTGMATRGQLTGLADIILPSIAGLPRWLDSLRLPETAA
ncbi:MAG: HAD family hydrolase [Qingshengfaniella sp.]